MKRPPDFSRFKTFRELVAKRGIGVQDYTNRIAAIEAVGLLARICEMGDQVLALALNRRISASQAETLIDDLVDCFAEPIHSTRRVIETGKQLRGCDL